MSHNTTWMSVDEASSFLNMGKTTLYKLAQEGRIPARKIGRKWAFDKAEVDVWIRSQHPMESFFLNLDTSIGDNASLRVPQREGYLRTYDFFRAGKNKAILQLPVGCGKTGLASLLPFGLAKGRVLVIAPNLTIKRELFDAMDITNAQKCFWRKTGVLSKGQTHLGPLACTLDSGNMSVVAISHIVVTNVQQLATNVDKWLTKFPNDFIDMIIVDEAHHSAAESWGKVIDHFPTAKVVHLTATPFRSDRKRIDGELVYRYSFRSAMLNGYIKRLKTSHVAPSEITLGFRDEADRTYTLYEVLELREEQWFSRGIALARPCNEHIVDNSLAKLEELRLTGTPHQLIAVACSINHAKEIRSLYMERGYSADVVHSKQGAEKQKTILNALYNGTLDCIVQVQMLGEGFDHPKLSVAAIFRPFRTLAPFIQFVGRIMRVVVQKDPSHPDNAGHIVTHLGMNLGKRLDEFKEFDNDDHAFWTDVIGEVEPEIPASVRDGSARQRTHEPVVVYGEVVESLWEEDLINIDDQQIVDDLSDRLKLYGLDPADAERLVRNSQRERIRKQSSSGPFVVQPQRELQEARKRLYEQGKRIAKLLLNRLDLSMGGVEVPRKYTSLSVPGRSNYICALMMINREINLRLGKERDEASVEDFKRVTESLDDILRSVAKRVHKAKSEYEQQA